MRISAFTTLGLAASLGMAGCNVCFSECVDDAGAADTDGGHTTDAGMNATATSTPPSTTIGPAATVCADESGGGETEETEGLSCGGTIPDVFDMKTVRAGDLVPPPASYSADTRFLVLRSQGSVCGPDPLAPPDCSADQEFTLVVVIPPEFQEPGTYFFGDYESETGFTETDLDAWIHIGGSECCEIGVIPDSSHITIDSISSDGSIIGQLCGFYWMPALGQGMSGLVDAAAC